MDGLAPSGLDTSRPPKLSKAAKKANKKIEHHYDEVNVVVTGFGVLDGLRESDTSWRVAKSLPPALPANAAHPTRIRIFVHPEPVSASYDAILKVTSQVFEWQTPIHLILHLGSALEDRSYYALERSARHTGYRYDDEDGHGVDSTKEPAFWGGLADELTSTSAMKDVLARWKGEAPENVDLRISSDAGHYLLEYQFYASLARTQHTGTGQLAWQDRPMASCLHLPKYTAQEDIDSEIGVVVALIYALIDSRRFRDGDYGEAHDGMGGMDPGPDGVA